MSYKILIILILIINLFSFNLSASMKLNSYRVDEILQTSFNHDGPNCFSTSLYASGLINSYSFINEGVVASLAKSPICEKVPYFEREKGDFFLVKNVYSRPRGEIGHMAIATSRDTAFAKMGHSKHNVIRNEKIDLSVGIYLGETECFYDFYHDNASGETSDESWCNIIETFRCRLDFFRNEILKSQYKDFFLQIERIAIIFSELTHSKNINENLILENMLLLTNILNFISLELDQGIIVDDFSAKMTIENKLERLNEIDIWMVRFSYQNDNRSLRETIKTFLRDFASSTYEQGLILIKE